jgi:hypothetical protein
MVTATPHEQPAAQYEIRRRHDASLISAHCCSASALQAFARLSVADMMGPNPPGLLEWAEVDIIEVETGQSVAFTRGLVQSDGQSPEAEHTYF